MERGELTKKFEYLDNLVNKLSFLGTYFKESDKKQPSIELVKLCAEIGGSLPELYLDWLMGYMEKNGSMTSSLLMGLASGNAYERYKEKRDELILGDYPAVAYPHIRYIIRTDAFTIAHHLEDFIRSNIEYSKHANKSIRYHNAFNLALALPYEQKRVPRLIGKRAEGNYFERIGVFNGIRALKRLGYSELLKEALSEQAKGKQILAGIHDVNEDLIMGKPESNMQWHAEYVARAWNLKHRKAPIFFCLESEIQNETRKKRTSLVELWYSRHGCSDMKDMVLLSQVKVDSPGQFIEDRLRLSICSEKTKSMADAISCATFYPEHYVLYSITNRGGFKVTYLGARYVHAWNEKEYRLKRVEELLESELLAVKIMEPTAKGLDILRLSDQNFMEALVTELGNCNAHAREHPNVSFIWDVFLDPRIKKYVIVEEWNNRGSLKDAFPELKEGKPIPSYETRADLRRQAYNGLLHLADPDKMNLGCHGDLKPENMLIHETNKGIYLRLTDFHSAVTAQKKYLNVGYPFPMEPKLLCTDEPASFWTDLFALGDNGILFNTGDTLVPSIPYIKKAEQMTGKGWDMVSIDERIMYVDRPLKQKKQLIMKTGLKKAIADRLGPYLEGKTLEREIGITYSLMKENPVERKFIPE